jgi:hypothetical protein
MQYSQTKILKMLRTWCFTKHIHCIFYFKNWRNLLLWYSFTKYMPYMHLYYDVLIIYHFQCHDVRTILIGETCLKIRFICWGTIIKICTELYFYWGGDVTSYLLKGHRKWFRRKKCLARKCVLYLLNM